MKKELQKSFPKYKSRQVRLAIPSKGRMESETQEFLRSCGFIIQRNNRQYIGSIESPINLQLVYQRQVDIVRGVLNGSLEMGIVGYDLVREYLPKYDNELIVIHDALNFGKCSLEIAIPEEWPENSIDEIKQNKKLIRVATKFPKLTKQFLNSVDITYELIEGNGSLEVYPELGYSDIIVDLVSTGQTLKDNRLKRINGGQIMTSESVLIGNRRSLKNETILKTARGLIEYIEATLRAQKFVSVFVNMRGESREEIAKAIFSKEGLEGLQGPTISAVFTKNRENMFAVHVIVERKNLQQAIRNLREIGGSGVVVAPALYIFEEEPLRYIKLLKNLGMDND
ncbi:MAG: ATP phosphoribosyltransferase [Candidatus Hermodarchaeota archaeon]